jgi:hypothetical protein
MIKSLIVRNYIGEEITITLTDADPSHGLLVKSMTGLGSPKGTINATDFAVIDGGLFNSARAEKRNIVLNFLLAQTSKCVDIETARQNTYRFFPLKKKVTLTFITDHRNCQISGYVESNEPDIFNKAEGCQISIICDNPYFHKIGEGTPQITNFSEVISLFEFPFENNSLDENEIEVSYYENVKEKILTYEGDVETGMLIKIHVLDSVGNILIYNFDTKEEMNISNAKIEALTGSVLKASDDLIISTDERNQYAELLREGVTTNVINAVDRHSDWLKVRKGNNIFAFTTDNETDDNLLFSIENDILYEGI